MNDEEIIKEVYEQSCTNKPHSNCLYRYDELIDCMAKAKAEAQKEFEDKIDFYFHKCWISKKVPKLEELKQSLSDTKEKT
jgi:hypothetical protein